MKTVIKRDGREVAFDSEKVRSAIRKAFFAVDGEVSSYAEEKANNISKYIEELEEDTLTVEDIQDYVENGLMASKRKDVARAYITYRNERTRARGNTTDETFIEFLSGQSDYWNNENSNKDAKVVTTQRDYMAGIASTDIARRFLLPKEVCEAHDAGIIHSNQRFRDLFKN